jgi:hypothetical protein
MKSGLNLLVQVMLLAVLAGCAPGLAQTPTPTLHPSPTGSTIRGVFEGITPCSSQTQALPQIPQDSDCELMTWKVILYQHSTGTPATYILESAYGPSQPNTTSPAGGGTVISMKGTWGISTGTMTDPEAEVFQLYGEDTHVAVSFVKMSEDLLHVLNKDTTLMVGNAAWSYTLNRTDNQAPAPLDGPVSSGPEATRPPIPETPPGSSVLGIFEGRLPCHEVVYDILNITPFSGCLKLKSRLTLYVDQATGAPSSYMYLGTSTIREGTWTILQGTKGDPDAIIYQIHLTDSKEPVSFLKADDNHLFLLDRNLNLLVGNALFSYTLSRIEKDVQ